MKTLHDLTLMLQRNKEKVRQENKTNRKPNDLQKVINDGGNGMRDSFSVTVTGASF